ncbi:vacuolar transmembrane protein [Penicillium ucsense]|uniref:Vacuolar transmembrane protein n=1 Tax=Penicillium ucsense TaxID=2839758 RepID=A0A8J8WJJ7_9EURO|nr:vacuolar transmembrane protein [Penicillium ucsense]KAF7738122.1 vacuolar transmembrane protein [Penicillium ucsense]
MHAATVLSLVASAATNLAIATPVSSSSPYFAASVSSSPTSTMLYSYNATASGDDSNGEDDGECKLLGPFSLLVQAALGALALSSLVYKRWRERPQRPLKVWAFDASKQVFGSGLLHLANLLMSMFSAGEMQIRKSYKPNPCSIYLLNLGIDTTLGIPILILILRLLNYIAFYTPLANPPESIESGNYGQPPRAIWWLKQSMIYFIGLLGMKVCVFFLISLFPFIIKVGDWALGWTEGNTALQIAFVMLLFPVIMNALQYYIIDHFIKKHGSPDAYTAPDIPDDEDDAQRRAALLDGYDDTYSSDSETEESGSKPTVTVSEATPKTKASELPGSEEMLTEDFSPVPPYESPSSSSSRSERK